MPVYNVYDLAGFFFSESSIVYTCIGAHRDAHFRSSRVMHTWRCTCYYSSPRMYLRAFFARFLLRVQWIDGDFYMVTTGLNVKKWEWCLLCGSSRCKVIALNLHFMNHCVGLCLFASKCFLNTNGEYKDYFS